LPGTGNLYVLTIYIDKSGKLWLGTFGNGLFLYDQGRLQPVHLFPASRAVSVTCISEDSSSRMWVGTLDNGLFIKDQHRIYQLDRTNGLSGNSVFFTYCDSSDSYIGSSGGLDIISSKTLEIDHQSRSEGYMGSECNLHAILKDDQGYLWIGTVNGLVRFARRFKTNTGNAVQLPPEIESAYLLPEDILIQSGAHLPGNKYSLIFRFHAIHFTSPEAVKYSYRLIGLDESWSPLIKQKSVTYSKLPPGKYQFQVRYTIDNGNHFSPVSSFEFHIDTPFWSRLEFIFSAVIIILLLLYLYHVFKRRRLEKEKARLEEEIAKKTRSLQLERDKLSDTLKQLRESEDKFKNLTESTSAGIFIYQG
ncbi:MAG: hypothetical protein D6732_17900, partial [Methanobacteriota archaeon]